MNEPDNKWINMLGRLVDAQIQSSSSQNELDINHTFNQVVSEIRGVLGHLNDDREKLAEELLDHYQQWNTAFDAATSVAQCKTVPLAINRLVEKIGQAINCGFAYFIGNRNFSFSPIGHVNLHRNVLTVPFPPQNEEAAMSFFKNHESALRALPDDKHDVQVSIIDYNGAAHHDNNGRGNVLALRLQKYNETHESPGCLIFVRSDQQLPFVALEMNIAATLSRLGAAVLENIIYAQKLHENYLQTIAALARAIETKDPYTCGHSTRVAMLASALGQKLGLPEGEIKIIEWAGLMHDIGKIGIRDDILCKVGRLTEEEYDHIKSHPIKSFNVLEPLESLRDILLAIRHHHENYDGSGYPDGLVGQAIPFRARILRVTDVWDAITSTRAYRPAMEYQVAIGIMRREAGITMDPELVRSFLELLDNNPNLRLVENRFAI